MFGHQVHLPCLLVQGNLKPQKRGIRAYVLHVLGPFASSGVKPEERGASVTFGGSILRREPALTSTKPPPVGRDIDSDVRAPWGLGFRVSGLGFRV